MNRFVLSRNRIAILVLGLAATGVAAAFMGAGASAEGRTLEGAFCGASHTCMTLSFDGVTYGTTNRDDFSLRPGTYWLSVNDNSTFHDFVLRSCTSSTSPCGPGDGTTQQITTVADHSGVVTIKMELSHGTYRLFCDVPGHEAAGMFVDFAVGGVGQVG